MKKLFKNIKRTSFLLALISSFVCGNVFAGSPKGRVEFVSGRAFLVSNGTTKVLKQGDHIYDLSDVITEEGAFLSFVNYFDQQFHLSGSGHIKIMNQIVELKRGYMWLESLSDTEVQTSIQTPNAYTVFDKGQAIISYDQYSGKTQILSIKGNFVFGNIYQDNLKVSVPGGEFSFVSKDYEEGSPRQPTPVGQSAFKKLTGLFSNKPEARTRKSTFTPKPRVVAKREYKSAEPVKSREIASVISKKVVSTKGQGKVTYRRTTQEAKEARENKMLKYYGRNIASLSKPAPKKKFAPSYANKSSVKIKVFGEKVKRKQRIPASATPIMKKRMKKAHRGPASISSLGSQVEIKNSAFESSLIREYKKQMRHKKEVNSLINDLKSYDQDYKQAY